MATTKKILIICGIIFFACLSGCKENDNHALFPLDKYNQNINAWINPNSPDYDKLIFSYNTQQERLQGFYKHYIGSSSPWSEEHVNKIILTAPSDSIKTTEQQVIYFYNNEKKSKRSIGYGENFRPYSTEWSKQISANINLAQFDALKYSVKNRAISIDNLLARALPTDDPFFYHYTYAGEGYPFDNLQISALWVGTPVYILGETKDHAWVLILTPDYIGWVKSNGIARVNDAFVKTWTQASLKQLAAIIKTNTSILDTQGTYRFSAFVGAVFPAEEIADKLKIMIPIANEKREAVISFGWLSNKEATSMPYTSTPRHFSEIIQTLLNRPYGWGNSNFYNDCSGEMKSLLTPFGFWLPRHSTDQIYIGRVTNLTKETPSYRLNYLKDHGRPFSTLIYVGGHILFYLGNFPDPHSAQLMPLTFQSVWGLRPNDNSRRAVIGQSVLFPLLLSYPEDKELDSQLKRKQFFLSQLNGEPSDLQKLEIINLKKLMYP